MVVRKQDLKILFSDIFYADPEKNSSTSLAKNKNMFIMIHDTMIKNKTKLR